MDQFDVRSISDKVIITVGHFGCGKTNVSVNLALKISSYNKACLIDYDNVNPYFRSADVKDSFTSKGIRVITSDFANTNVDIPSVSPLVYSALTDAENGQSVIFDVGGDMLGAVSLGFLHDKLAALSPVVLYVFSAYRPLTDTPEKAYEIMTEIENACGFKVTALVNNSNLGSATTKEDVEESAGYAEKLCKLSKIPLLFTSYIPGITNEKPDIKGAGFEMINMTKKLF